MVRMTEPEAEPQIVVMPPAGEEGQRMDDLVAARAQLEEMRRRAITTGEPHVPGVSGPYL
jgi:hypothetical protein